MVSCKGFPGLGVLFTIDDSRFTTTESTTRIRHSTLILYFASMKKLLYLSPLLLLFNACNNGNDTPRSENDLDAVRNFVQAALYGDYNKAKTYMLKDSLNLQQLDAIQRVPLSSDEKKGLASASIIIHDVNHVNDSTTVVVYSNSFKNNWDTLKAVKQANEWLVDFSYLFNHDMDTSLNKKDSLNNK